jgi:hypothetical protein
MEASPSQQGPSDGTGAPDDSPPNARRVQAVTCGNCGWPSACVAQNGMRLLSFVCHWCGKTTVGVVDPTIRRNVIF